MHRGDGIRMVNILVVDDDKNTRLFFKAQLARKLISETPRLVTKYLDVDL